MPATATKSPTARDILAELKPLGSPSYKKVLLNHGVQEPFYGVKIEHLKKIQKRIKKDHPLALDLYDTGVYDAMYLAGLIADEQRMTKKDLQRWLDNATSPTLAEYTVPWVAAEGPHGHDLALEWIDSNDESTAAAGWSTLSGLVALKDDADLDLREVKKLLQRIAKTIHSAPSRVRYAMNGFLIAAGSSIASLTDHATTLAKKIGLVTVHMGNTSCKVPDAAGYIEKIKQRGGIGKKRKSVRC